jgi:hypothetical protein
MLSFLIDGLEEWTWPPKSPNLTPLDCFMSGYVKNTVYAEKIHDLYHLQNRIYAFVVIITLRTVHTVPRTKLNTACMSAGL